MLLATRGCPIVPTNVSNAFRFSGRGTNDICYHEHHYRERTDTDLGFIMSVCHTRVSLSGSESKVRREVVNCVAGSNAGF